MLGRAAGGTPAGSSDRSSEVWVTIRLRESTADNHKHTVEIKASEFMGSPSVYVQES